MTPESVGRFPVSLAQGVQKARAGSLKRVNNIILAPAEEFGCRRWGRRSQVGNKVGYRVIWFVPYRGNDWDGRTRHGACHNFLVKRPEVFQRTPATPNDHGVEGFGRVGPEVLVKQVDRLRDFRRSFGTLHATRRDNNVQIWEATPEDREDIADGSSRGRGNNSDAPWNPGDGAFTRSVAKPFGEESTLQLLKAQEQIPDAVAPLKVFDVEVVATVWRVERNLSRNAHSPAILKNREGTRLADLLLLTKGEEGGVELGFVVAQREIEVPGCGRGAEVGDLALNRHPPDVVQAILDDRRNTTYGITGNAWRINHRLETLCRESVVDRLEVQHVQRRKVHAKLFF